MVRIGILENSTVSAEGNRAVSIGGSRVAHVAPSSKDDPRSLCTYATLSPISVENVEQYRLDFNVLTDIRQ